MQKLAQICVQRPVFATMLILALVVLGLSAYMKLGVDLYPKIDFPVVTVTTTLRGASPEEVETQVTKRIEESVNTTSGIDELRSLSAEGVSIVWVTFVLEKDPDVAAQEVRDKVAGITRDLPKDVDPPVIEKISTDASPVISVVVSSRRDLRETTKIVDDQVKKNIESIDGVGQVRFIGDRARQIQVWLDGGKLYSYNLNIDQVRGALAAQNVEIPGGRVDQGARELSLRTLGRIEHPADFAGIIVASLNGSPVRIRDIGTVEDGVEEARSLARLDGEPAVVLEVRKQSGTNTLDVVHAVKARIAQLQPLLPPDFKITYTGDESTFIEESFKAVQEHLLLGGLCAGFVVLLFMRSWRTTLIAALAIPISIVSTYSLMNLMGFTLNQITMLALVLVVGIVIDDAIVVLENIFRNAEEKHLPPFEAAIQGTKEIGLAVMATTFSLVIIFLPVAMMTGIVGRFMSSFGYTAAFAVLVSLLVSFTLTPMLASRFLKLGDGKNGASTKDTVLFRALAGPYRRMLYWSMAHRWVIVLCAVTVAFSTIPMFLHMGKDFLPVDDQSEFEIAVRMPVGSSLDGSSAMMREIESDVHTLPGIRNVLTTLGADSRRQVDRGSLMVELVPVGERSQTQFEIMLQARERLRKYRDLTIAVQPPAMFAGAGPNKDLQFFIQGPDFAHLERYVGAIRAELARTTGVRDLESSYEPGKPELRVHINRAKAADLGVNVASIATALRTLVGGDPQVTTYREGDDRYDVQLRVEKQFRDSARALERLYVPSAALGNVPVSNVVTVEEGTGPAQIDRVNRQRQITLTANFAEGQSLSNVIGVLDRTTAALNMPPEYRFGLLGRSKEFGRASMGFVVAFLLSIIFMYMVLAAQFESFIDPVTILISLPLAVPFALLTLVLAGENFQIIYTSLGILMLFGIVKKNAILQIDHIKALRFKEGRPRQEAILRGCEDRLRPILMTTASLVAGMLPMALGGGAGASSRRSIAIVVIGGQTLCLLLTLLVTPVTYSLFDDLGHFNLWARTGAFLRGLKPRRALGVTAPLVLLLVALAAASGARAADDSAPRPAQAEAYATQPRVGVGATQRKMALREAIELALGQNLDIEIEKTNRAAALQAFKGAHGFLDTTLNWSPSILSAKIPTGSVLMGADGILSEHVHTENFSVRQMLPWGGAGLEVDFDNSRQSSTNPFESLNPYFNSQLTVSFTQPLLRNRAIDPYRAELKIRRKRLDLSDTDFALRNIDVVTRVEQAYWDLVAARQAVDVLSDSVEWARQQLAMTKRMVAAGTQAQVEISAAEAELERRLDTHYSGVGSVTEAENGLKLLLTSSRENALWDDEIVPVDIETLEPPEAGDLREAVGTALQHRPEMRAIATQREVAAVQTKLGADQLKPQLNFVAAYANTGLAGTVAATDPLTELFGAMTNQINELSGPAGLPPIAFNFGALPPGLTGGYGKSLANLFSGSYPTVQVGLTLDLTPRNRAAHANLAQSTILERRLKLEQTRLELGIEAQVRNAMQALATARQRIVAAEASARAAKEKLDSETRMYQSGESTNFLVLTRQNEYADSRRRDVVARLDANKAIAQLRQAVGSTLDAYKIRLQ
ncbi:MAG: efflux RND transporter permease subunit [Bryobacteraceae bacterium]|jgi:HAE1 family hydrophobic/amphiphilic exporter-1